MVKTKVKNIVMDETLKTQIMTLRQTGQLDAACQLLQNHCQQHRDDLAAQLLLGQLQAQMGQYILAAQTFRKLIKQAPVEVLPYYNLAKVYAVQSDWIQAATTFEKGMALTPKPLPVFLLALGQVYLAQGRYEAARDCLFKVINDDQCSNAEVSEARFNLGCVLVKEGVLEDAVILFDRLMNSPLKLKASLQLANIYLRQDDLEAAKSLFKAVLSDQPTTLEAHHNLGVIAFKQRRYKEAVAYYEMVLSKQSSMPNNPVFKDALINYGNVLSEVGQAEAALDKYKQADVLAPNNAFVLNNMGYALEQLSHYEAAANCYQQALVLQPEFPEACNNLAMVYEVMARFEESDAWFLKALALRPDYREAHSNRLYLLSYHVLKEPQAMLDAHIEWAHQFATPEMAARYSWPRPKNLNTNEVVDRPLRIGYVSPDFRRHSVSYFIEPVIEHHDRSRVEVYCYAEVAVADEVTARIEQLSDGWRLTKDLSDEAVADMIHADEIDVLIDLAGHTGGNRLGVFSYRPAPVQMTYLGYFTGTGLAAMDYWISDEVAHPIDTVEQSVEEIIRLPRCCVSYSPHDEAPKPVARDAQGPIVFGSFNDITKVSPEALRLWSRVMLAVPGSQLLIKAKQLSDELIKRQVIAAFKAEGIDESRLILRGRTQGYEEHMATYHEVDIALDTIPRTGVTTTAEALWMGVAVVTLAGPRFIERLSASILQALKLDNCISHDEAGYVDAVVSLANDRAALAALRLTLRTVMRESSLCDSIDMAKSLEQVYHTGWQRYLTDLQAKAQTAVQTDDGAQS